MQKTTLILILLATLLGGFVYFYEIKGAEQREANQAKGKQIFDFEEAEIKKITIEKQNEILEFIKTNDETKPWLMKKPEDVAASDAAVSFLLNLLVKGESDRTFAITPNQEEEYGFNNPLAKVKIELKNQENYQIILGKTSFDNQFIYAQISPQKERERLPSQETREILLVKIDFKYAVERELQEWKDK